MKKMLTNLHKEAKAQELLALENNTGGWEMLSLDEALVSLEEGLLPPSVQNFTCILHKCRKERNLSDALRLHAYMRKSGMEAHTSLGNYLVSMLADVGCMNDAHQVFDRLVHRNERSWNSLITGYIKCGESQLALTLYQKMQEDFVYPSKYTYMALLKACTKLKDAERGRKIHAEIGRKGLLDRDPFIGSTLVDMYAKCGLLGKAREVFDKLPVRDVVSWTALVAGYAKHGCGEEALKCFEQMQCEGISPNTITFVCSLKACGSIGATDKGREIHAEVSRKGLEGDIFVGSTLVDMYAKCGLLEKAQQVFDKLPVRGVVPWTMLIAGFAKHKRVQEALNCFEQMQLEGVSPDANTYVCCLKACGSIGAIDKGREIHAQIARKGLERDLVVGNALVDMYANCGFLGKAREVFDKLLVRNVVSWTALIAGYTEHGCGEEALNCFEQMQHEGISPDAVTFVCSLKACGNIGATGKGQEIHAEIARKGLLGRDLVVGNALVDMYASCGLLAKAHEVFERLPVRDVVSWTALIAGYVEQGRGEEALDCFEKMQLTGISPDTVTYVCSLKACGSIGAMDKGGEIHAEITRNGLLERDLVICNSLVDMYAKCGLFAKAQEVFDNIPVRDAVSWNALIAGYVKHGYDEEALNCFAQMQLEGVSPNAATFACSLRACGGKGATDKGREIHAEIARKGLLERDLAVGNTLVDMYANCGLLAKAEEVFDKLPAQDLVSWNALIAGYTKHGRSEEALNCFEQMQLMGVSCDAATFVCVLKACGSLGATGKGQEIHAEIVRKGLERDSVVGNVLVDMYANCGVLAKAHEVFDKLLVRDVVSWTALIAGYVKQGLGEGALNCFEQMQREGVSPDVVTFVCSLKACGSIGALGKGHEIHAAIARKGLLERDPIIGNALVDMYVNCGLPAKAQEVFDKLAVHDTVSWTALITGYAQLGESENVFYNFDRMKREGKQPNLVTFIGVLNACSHAGLVDKGQMYFEAINEDYGFTPTLEHYNCMVDLLGRAGQLDKAVAMIKKMPFHPNLVVWHTVLGACRKWGNVELGKQAFEHALRFDEKNSAAFVCMSNIYAEADMQEDAKKWNCPFILCLMW